MNLAKSQLYNRSQITGWFSLVVTQNATATASTTAKLILCFWIRNWLHIATRLVVLVGMTSSKIHAVSFQIPLGRNLAELCFK